MAQINTKYLKKLWEKPKNLEFIKPSPLEKNAPSVKKHWKKVINDMDTQCHDERFWETQKDAIKEYAGPVIFKRLVRIFDLAVERPQYEPKSETSSMVHSEELYVDIRPASEIDEPLVLPREPSASSEVSENGEKENLSEEEEQQWSEPSERSSVVTKEPPKVDLKPADGKSPTLSKTMLKTSMKSLESLEELSPSELAYTDDDMEVHLDEEDSASEIALKKKTNPHFHLLYCNKSETDMITWNSKYKQKSSEVSATDEFNKKAEILTKKIVQEFYDWWVGLGNVEFKSEIRRPEDLEGLFQVWFDEQASRGLLSDPKILPCVLQTISDVVRVPEAACPNILQKQIECDIHAEKHPRHTTAFNRCLPQEMKHLPPTNNTEKIWYCVKIPEDLRSMSRTWDDIMHLTSTNSFKKWLEKRPHMPMPPCLRDLGKPQAEKKQGFAVPSDFVLRDRSTESTNDLAFPMSQIEIELKDVLSKLMN